MSVATNDRKREEMSRVVSRLLDVEPAWTTAQLAALMHVARTTIGAWKRGESMGTNAQRAALAKLGSPRAEHNRIVALVQTLEREAVASDNLLQEEYAAGAHNVAKFRQHRIDRIRARVALLRELFNTP